MYGPPPVMSPVPPPRAARVTGLRIALWVLVGVVMVGGVGFFAFIPLTALAVRGRSLRDALLAVGAFALMVAAVAAAPQHQDTAHQPWWYGVLAFSMLGQGIATTAWFVVSDRRWLRARQQLPVPRAGHWAPPAPGPTTVMPTVAQPPIADAVPSVPPMPAQPHRLGQVRAELDELSDYLRREQGR